MVVVEEELLMLFVLAHLREFVGWCTPLMDMISEGRGGDRRGDRGGKRLWRFKEIVCWDLTYIY